jgi:hypothetical protein
MRQQLLHRLGDTQVTMLEMAVIVRQLDPGALQLLHQPHGVLGPIHRIGAMRLGGDQRLVLLGQAGPVAQAIGELAAQLVPIVGAAEDRFNERWRVGREIEPKLERGLQTLQVVPAAATGRADAGERSNRSAEETAAVLVQSRRPGRSRGGSRCGCRVGAARMNCERSNPRIRRSKKNPISTTRSRHVRTQTIARA